MEYMYPGLNCRVDEVPQHPAYSDTQQGELYPTALGNQYYHKDGATTLREKKWQGMMNDITDKPDWQNKTLNFHPLTIQVRNEEITAKWKQEALEYGKSSPEGFSEKMADRMIKELQHKADNYEKTGWVTAYDPGVIKSDVAVSEGLKKSLQTAVQVLECVPEAKKDWHPGSNDQVLDLVHPSLWPLIYGKTRMLPPGTECSSDPIADIGTGQTLSEQKMNEDFWQYSKVFQWLPAEIRFNENNEAKFSSYINNLHPQKHRDLYHIIEKVIDAAIPLWSRTLSSWPIQERIPYESIEYDDIPEVPMEEDEDEIDYAERSWSIIHELKAQYIIQPEPANKKINYKITDLKKRFHAGLQVIVKLANIELKPGEGYAGGSWHVEGQANEHIVATALYYYDSHNITESRLAFRRTANEEQFDQGFGYEQEEHQFLDTIFGLENRQAAVQDVGSVRCQEGRLITFPNMLQHQVYPFELQDKSKPGHRKILALFLVDPHLSIISTRVVPPQRQDWWLERLQQTRIPLLDKLPPELFQHVLSYVDDPMPLKEAKEWRLELIGERSHYVQEQGVYFYDANYNLCEH